MQVSDRWHRSFGASAAASNHRPCVFDGAYTVQRDRRSQAAKLLFLCAMGSAKKYWIAEDATAKIVPRMQGPRSRLAGKAQMRVPGWKAPAASSLGGLAAICPRDAVLLYYARSYRKQDAAKSRTASAHQHQRCCTTLTPSKAFHGHRP